MKIRQAAEAFKRMVDYGKRLFYELAVEMYALYIVMKEPRVPLRVKLIVLVPVVYFISPIDIIMDPIPVLGQLDDLIVFRYSYKVIVRLIPPGVLSDCRKRSHQALVLREESLHRAWLILVLISILLAIFGIVFLVKKMKRGRVGTSLSSLVMS
jgi:uncharacterized membrane protein YkvA (DUF1232 family)